MPPLLLLVCSFVLQRRRQCGLCEIAVAAAVARVQPEPVRPEVREPQPRRSSRTLHEDGREQVTGFQMSGEIIGLDGIVEDKHRCDSVALEDAEVCVIPFDSVEHMSREIPAVQHHVHRIMSREIVRENSVMLLLGNAQAEERLAAFLVNWGQRLQARGFSATELVLRMTRQDLGNYLGLKIETVSRTLTKLVGRGILTVDGREIHIVDMSALRAVASGEDAH